MDYAYSRNEYIAGIFDRAAQTYSCIGPGYFTYFGQKLVEDLSINPGTSLLDIACGRGAILFPASDATGPQGKAIGIDFSHNMIKETQTSIFDNGYSHTLAQQMNAEELLFEDYSFDTITCGFAIQFFANYQLALKEMYRVLKTNGKIGISSWKRQETKPIIARIFPKYFPQNDSQHSTEPNSEFGIPHALEEMFLSAGFKNIIVTEQSKRFYYRDEEHWWQDQWSHGGRIHLEAVEKLGCDAMENFKIDVTNELKETTDENGIYIDANALFVIANK